MIRELDRQQERTLSKIMDAYQIEIKLELFFNFRDEESVYLESILNSCGVLYRQVLLSVL